MPGRTRGDAAVRRVVEQLFALTLDDGADASVASTSGDAGQPQIPDAVSARRGASPSPPPAPPSVERTVAALKAAYAEEKYADVRAAVVVALQRVPHPARFVLRCVEALANESHDECWKRKEAERTKPTRTRGVSPSEPVTHLLLEALGSTECVAEVRRPVFAATEPGTRLVDPEARAAAAALLARTFRGAVLAARSADADAADAEDPSRERNGRSGGSGSLTSARLQPRTAARLAAVAGVDLADLEAHDPRPRARPSVEHALHWYVGACVGGALGAPALTKENRTDPDEINARTADKSSAAARVSAAVRLVRHFSLAAFATPSALDAIERCGHGALADGVAACLPKRERERYVRRLAERDTRAGFHVGGISAAERAERRMRRLGLPPTFPERDRAREEARVRYLCAQGRWEVADALAGEDPGLRAAMAQPSSSRTRGTENDAHAQRRRATLPLDLPSGAVVFADDARSLRRAARCLARDAVIGLDTEWRPDSASGKNKTSLLQLAGRRSAALLDVPALCATCAPDAIDEALRAILCAPREWIGAEDGDGDDKNAEGISNDEPPIVLGFGLAEDLRRAARSWPASLGRALAAIPRAVCLQMLCASSLKPGSNQQPALPGLSATAARFLGAPLDKTETCSDWNRRPLSSAQTEYAAQDARVLVRLLPGVLGAATMEDAARIARDTHAAPAVPAMLTFPRARSGDGSLRDDAFDGEFAPFERDAAEISAEDNRERPRRASTGSRSIARPASSALSSSGVPDDDDGDGGGDDDAILSPLSPSDTAAALVARLAPSGVDPTPIRLPPRTGPSAADTAAALGPDVPVDAVVKSIGVVIELPARNGTTSSPPSGSSSASAVAAALGAPFADGADAAEAPPGRDATEKNTFTEPLSRVPALLMLRGSDRVDLRVVASRFGVAKRKVRLATPEECVRIFGYPPGSMPPLGLRGCASLAAKRGAASSSAGSAQNGSIPALMDAAVHALGSRDVYPGAGAPDLVFRCPADTLAEATRADVIALAAPKTAPTPTPTPTPTAASPPNARAERKRFVADGALGRLARWLRALGVDAEHVPAGAAGEYGGLFELATTENRVVLTRDRRVALRREFRDVGVFVVEPDDPREQLRLVAARFGLAFQRGRLLTRCAKCNGEVQRKLTPEEVAAHPRIPAKVKRAAEDFWACGRCAKVYWIGPKSHKAMDFIREDLMDMLVSKNTPDFIKENFAEGSAGASEQDREALMDAAARGDAWPRGER